MIRTRIFVAALLACLAGHAGAAAFKIMIVTWNGCEEPCAGFREALQEHHVDAEFIVRDAAESKAQLPVFLAEAQARKVDLILTYGTSVSLGIAGTLTAPAGSEVARAIPKVFMLVADPVTSGLVKSLDEPGRPDVTGTYNRVPEQVNIETIRTYSARFKRLGMLVVSTERNSVLKRDEMAALAGPMGYELLSRDVGLDASGKPDVADIRVKLDELKAAGADFIYLGSSSFLREQRDVFTDAALKAGLPVLSPYEILVRESRGLMSVAARYRDVGRLAAEQARKILVDRRAPGELPVLRMTRFAVVINMSVAKQLRFFPPIELLQVAETVN